MTDDHLDVQVLGGRVRVPLPHPWLTADDRAELRDLWSYAADPDDGSPAVTVEAPAVSQASDLRRLASAISTHVTLAALQRQAGRALLLHAAGVAEPGTGRTLALVGPSGRGKTTVARALGRHWSYVSDETVAVDPRTLAVAAHPKPLSVVPAEGGTKRQIGPQHLDLLRATRPLTLARIVVLQRDPHHTGEPTIIPLGVPHALGELVPQASYLSRWQRPLATMARVVAATGGALGVRYTEADDLTGALADLLTASAPTDWHVEPDPRVPEVVSDADAAAVLLGTPPERVVVLDGIGPQVWRHVGSEATVTDELVAAVVDAHGAPPHGSAHAAVRECVAALADHGLLMRGVEP